MGHVLTPAAGDVRHVRVAGGNTLGAEGSGSSERLRGGHRWDAVLSVAALVALAPTAWSIECTLHAGVPSHPAPPLAHVVQLAPSAKQRLPNDVVWYPLRLGDGLARGAGIYTSSESAVVLQFADGAELRVGENSLVVVDRLEMSGASVPLIHLQQGRVTGHGGASGLRLRSQEDGTAAVAPKAVVTVDRTDGSPTHIIAQQGTVEVHGTSDRLRLRHYQTGILRGGAPHRNPTPAVVLLEPPPHAFVRLGTHESIAFRWALSASVLFELAADPRFSQVYFRQEVEGGRCQVPGLTPGVHYWRLLETDGPQCSEVRTLTVVAKAAPAPIAPAAAAILYRPSVNPSHFVWTELSGVYGYRLEIAVDPSFQRIVREVTVDAPRYRLVGGLLDGVYYWRVSARAPDDRWGPTSVVRSFRLIESASPRPPVLRDPSLELYNPGGSTETGLWWRWLLGVAHAHP